MANGNAGFDEILLQLRATNALLAIALERQYALKQGELIAILRGAGISTGDIAQILGTTANTVQVTLSRHKKARKPAQPRKKSSPSECRDG